MRAHDVLPVTSSGFESVALHRALYLREVGNTSARMRGTAPRQKIREETLQNGLDRCYVTLASGIASGTQSTLHAHFCFNFIPD